MTSAEFIKEIEYLKGHTASLEEHVKYLYDKKIDIPFIYTLLCVYMREVLQQRIKATPTRTYIEKLRSAMPYPDDEIVRCLFAMGDDNRVEFSEDQSYVIWKGPDYIPGVWNREWASIRNRVDEIIVRLSAEENKAEDEE